MQNEYSGNYLDGTDNVHGVRFLRVLLLEDHENSAEVRARTLTLARFGTLEVGKFP